MPPYTSPNQRVVNVHRVKLDGNFLGINNDNWKAAARVLSAPAFKLYIYFASNKDDYKFALSPAALQSEIGMPRSTFYDQFRVLESHGFLVKGKGNMYHFYEVPQSGTQTPSACVAVNSEDEEITAAVNFSPKAVDKAPQENIQIYNKELNEETNIPREKPNTDIQRSRYEVDKSKFIF